MTYNLLADRWAVAVFLVFCVQVGGCVDAYTIAQKFAVFFNNNSCNNVYQKVT